MKRSISTLALYLFVLTVNAQTGIQRIVIDRIVDTSFNQWNYNGYLNDNVNNTVPFIWNVPLSYSTVKIKLTARTVITRLSLYDSYGVFSDNPAYLYAANEKDTICLGSFTGSKFMVYTDITSAAKFLATHILMKKFGNNIPQKIQIFGIPYQEGTLTNSTPDRLAADTVLQSANTGMDFSPWLSDNLSQLVQNNNAAANQVYNDVSLRLKNRSLIHKISLYDGAGSFAGLPCIIFLQKDSTLSEVGRFNGMDYNKWVDLQLPQGKLADAIVIRKFGNNIPQKVKAFGDSLLTDPYKITIGPAQEAKDSLIELRGISESFATGMNYTPWLNESLDTLVKSLWTNQNLHWTDVTIKLPGNCNISNVSLYDYEGVFTTNPASIFYKCDTTLTLIGTFTGQRYKEFINYPLPGKPKAGAIVIRKYSNNIPQKIKVTGKWNSAVTDTTSLIAAGNTIVVNSPLSNTVKIPVEVKRWYYLSPAPTGIGALFNGITNEAVATGYSHINNRYDCVYPVEKTEAIKISEIRMFDANGIFSNEPVLIYAIKQDGKRVNLATFTGSKYNEWVGPYPERNTAGNARFVLDTAVDSIAYIGISCYKNDLPTELEFYGNYSISNTTSPDAVEKKITFSSTLGTNCFEWDFVNPAVNSRVIDETKYRAIKNFRAVRHYLDWYRLEDFEGQYTFNPCHWGGWDYDMTYERCKRDSITVLTCIQNIPRWMKETYPADQQFNDNIPHKYGKSPDSASSYIEYARVGFQFAARYGDNPTVDLNLIKVNTTPRWTLDPANTVKRGLRLVKYIEAGNELDKWWKGANGYMNCYQMAAMMSAFYDGHKKALGTNAGVKNADSSMVVLLPGLALQAPGYIRGMIEWCRQNRGYRADGSVDICWDVVNYHHFSDNGYEAPNGIATRGCAPEVSDTRDVIRDFKSFSKKYLNNMPVWITEAGFDLNQQSSLRAIPVAGRTAEQSQADWILRSALLYLREGVEKLFFYELKDFNANSEVKFSSMGLTDSLLNRRPALNYLSQVDKLMGSFSFGKKIQELPAVDEYNKENKKIYAVWVPGETGASIQCKIPVIGADSVFMYTPLDSGETMARVQLQIVNDSVTVMAKETPVFIEPVKRPIRVPKSVTRQVSQPNETTTSTDETPPSVRPYPNPYTENVYFTIKSETAGKFTIELMTMNGKRIAPVFFGTIEKDESKKIKISVPEGATEMLIYRYIKDGKVVTGKILNTAD